MMRSSVDLPQPDGPSRQTNSPSLMSRLMSRMAAKRLAPLPYVFTTSRTLSRGSLMSLHFVPLFGDAIQALPERTVDEHHGEDQGESSGEQQRIVGLVRRFGDH